MDTASHILIIHSTFMQAVIKPLIKKPQLLPCWLILHPSQIVHFCLKFSRKSCVCLADLFLLIKGIYEESQDFIKGHTLFFSEWQMTFVPQGSILLVHKSSRTFFRKHRIIFYSFAIVIASTVWSTTRLSTRATSFHALRVTLGRCYLETLLAFTVMLMIISSIFLRVLTKHTNTQN